MILKIWIHFWIALVHNENISRDIHLNQAYGIARFFDGVILREKIKGYPHMDPYVHIIISIGVQIH